MNHLAGTTAALLIGGGGYAYVKVGSVPSLAGSLATAAIFLGSNYMITRLNQTFYGCVLGAIGGASIMGIACMRWGKSKTVFVPLTLMCLGLVNLGFYGMKSFQWKDTVTTSKGN